MMPPRGPTLGATCRSLVPSLSGAPTKRNGAAPRPPSRVTAPVPMNESMRIVQGRRSGRPDTPPVGRRDRSPAMTAPRRKVAAPAPWRFSACALTLVTLTSCGSADAGLPPLGTSSQPGRQPMPVTTPTTPEPAVTKAKAPAKAPVAATPGPALHLMATLIVKGRGPKTRYSREQFGPAWADANRNGCDTRNDILRRDLTRIALRPNSSNCVVISGGLADPYTGRTILFTKADASAVQIDHVIALSDAWQKGAARWPSGTRIAFANDPLNLLAVDGPANMSKGDSDAASWLPPNKGYRCSYVARQIAVKARYAVTVTSAERAAMARVLSACPTQATPAGGGLMSTPVGPPIAPSPDVAPPATSPKPTGETDPRFLTCRAAISAGYGPYSRGVDAEYTWYRDADSNGVTCQH